MLSFECIKNEKSVYFLLTSALEGSYWAAKSSTAAKLPKLSQKTSPRGRKPPTHRIQNGEENYTIEELDLWE